MNRRFVIAAAVVLFASLGAGWGVGQFRKSRTPPESPAAANGDRGALLYQVYCASCHGPDGHGGGPSAAALRPPPRSFASRPWRSAVTADAIRKVIVEGIPGTAMPGNPALAPADVETLADFVLRLATRPDDTSEASPEQTLLRDAGFVDLRGTAAPPLTVVDAAKNTIKLSELKGKLVLVHFWGLNCVHCLKGFPRLKALEAEFAGRGLVALHVCTDADDLAEAEALADRQAPGLRVVADDTGLAAARFEVQALPTIWLIDADGKPVARSSGARDWGSAELRRVLENWLPKP